ncbi:hypothetical protein PMAYCL1PPCAC_25031, partial [Pristionchus mayeri]
PESRCHTMGIRCALLQAALLPVSYLQMVGKFLDSKILQSVSPLSLHSLLDSSNNGLNDVVSQATALKSLSPFDVSTCCKGKGCFFPNDCVIGGRDNACSVAFSFHRIDETFVKMELLGAIDGNVDLSAFYVAVGFSDDDDKMGDEPTTECSRLGGEAAPSIKASYILLP